MCYFEYKDTTGTFHFTKNTGREIPEADFPCEANQTMLREESIATKRGVNGRFLGK